MENMLTMPLPESSEEGYHCQKYYNQICFWTPAPTSSPSNVHSAWQHSEGSEKPSSKKNKGVGWGTDLTFTVGSFFPILSTINISFREHILRKAEQISSYQLTANTEKHSHTLSCYERRKTQSLRDLLSEVSQDNNDTSNLLEQSYQKIFQIWK